MQIQLQDSLVIFMLAGVSGCLIDHQGYSDRLQELSDEDGDGYRPEDGDCNDNDPNINPGEPEVCGDVNAPRLDENCDGLVDVDAEGSRVWYEDADGDGFGNEATETTACFQPDLDWVLVAGDCDDTDAAIVVPDWHPDEDEDGYGNADISVTACEPPTDYISNGDDCDDTTASVSPAQLEICGDLVDNDCDGETQECLWPDQVTMTNETTIRAGATEEAFGYVGTSADLDANGLPELVISAVFGEDPDTLTRLGSISIFETPIKGDLNRLDANITLTGNQDNAFFGDGFAVADFNGDDYDDLIATAPEALNVEGVEVGATYLMYGPITDGGILPEMADWTLWGSDPENRIGAGFAEVGDIDGDGRLDFVSSYYAATIDEVNFTGLAYLVTTIGSGESTLRPNAQARFLPDRLGEGMGVSMTGGDFDGDGLGDLAIGALFAYTTDGAAYIFDHGVEGDTVAGDAEMVIIGESNSWATTRMMSPGDLNDDGIDDLVITALYADRGSAYVVWGESRLPPERRLVDADISIRGNVTRRIMAHGIGDIDDLNNDGHKDIIIGEGLGTPCDAVLFYGPFNETATLTSTDDADVRFVGDPAQDTEYRTMFQSPDMTGDGIEDLVIASWLHGDRRDGVVYLIEGQSF